MKKIKKTSCNTQSIKRFLSPQPSNIPTKKPRKTGIKIGPKSKMRGTCFAAQNEENCVDEMQEKNNVVAIVKDKKDFSTNCSSQCKCDWNSFVRDPGELNEARYPVTLNTFKLMTHSITIVKRILEDIKHATGLDFLSDQLMEERVLKNYYKQFYEQPQIRDIYRLETKACPVFVKKKIMQIPKLEFDRVATKEAQTVNSDDANKTTQVQLAEQVDEVEEGKIPQPVEARSTKAQVNSLTQLSTLPNPITNHGNIIYIPKGRVMADSNFLLNHIRCHVEDVGKHQEILERIMSEVFQKAFYPQHNRSEQKVAVKMCVEEAVEELSDMTVTSQNTTIENSSTQRIQEAKELFFREFKKSNTLPYVLRYHKGTKRRIIEAILTMTFEEFKKYTKIYNASEFYDDNELLGGCYDYAIKEPQLWPINLYMPLNALFEFLKLKDITLSGGSLEDVSPMLLHWSELAATTNFDDIMRRDYYRKGEKFNQTENLDIYRNAFYEKLWFFNIWLHNVPKVQIKAQASQILEKEAESETVSNSDSTIPQTETLEERVIEFETDNVEKPEQMNVDITEHTEHANGDTEMRDLRDQLKTFLPNNGKEHKTQSIEAVEHIKQERNCVLEEPTSAQTSTIVTNQSALMNDVAMDNVANNAHSYVTEVDSSLTETQAVLGQNMDNEAQARLKKAIDLYFTEVEKSCTLPYLLRYESGLNRLVIASILNMSFLEFKQYTHIYEAPEIYENVKLLKRCYEHTIKAPQVWPINLYVRLTDLFQYLKSKDVILPEISLKYISPKLLHWRNLISTTNFDYIVIWDYYRSTGKKINRSKTLLDPYRQSFYEQCWFFDKWIWHAPTILTKVVRCIANEQSSSAMEEDSEGSVFEKSVELHAVEQVQEMGATNVANEVASGGNERGKTVEHRLPKTVETGIQTSQGLLGEYLNPVQAANSSDPQNVDNSASTVLPVQSIKQEKLVPLNKLQFNLTEDEENYECVQAPDEVVELDTINTSSQSQEQMLIAPLSNSETLTTHEINGLLSSCSVDTNAPASVISQSQKSNELNSQQSRIELNEDMEQKNEQQQQLEQSLFRGQRLNEVHMQQPEQMPQSQQKSLEIKAKQDEPLSVRQLQIQAEPELRGLVTTTSIEFETHPQPQVLDVEEKQADVTVQPIQQKQHAYKNLQHSKPQKASPVEQQPHLMRIKQEQAKALKQQEQGGPTTSAIQIRQGATSHLQQNEQTMDIANLCRLPAANDDRESQVAANKQPSFSLQSQISRVDAQKQIVQQRLETSIQQQCDTDEKGGHSKVQQELQVHKQLTESPIPQTDQRTEQLQQQQIQVQTAAEQQPMLVPQKPSNTQAKLHPAQVCVEQQAQQPQQNQDIEAQLQVIFGESAEMRFKNVQPTMTPQIQEAATAAPQLKEPPTQLTTAISEHQSVQQQSSQVYVSRNDATEAYRKVEFISQNMLQDPPSQPEQAEQHLQKQQQHQQLAQPQLILQRTHTQVKEQLMLGPSCSLPQEVASPVPPLAKLSQQPKIISTCTTKTKTVKSTKAATTRKVATKQSDYVPQITHNFQPLPIGLNTKKSPAYSAPLGVISHASVDNQNPVSLQQNHLTPAANEQVFAAVTLPSPNPNNLVLSLPAPRSSSSSNSSSNSSIVYALSGDSTFFNSSDLLKAIERYQLQRSQQQQHQQQQQQQIQLQQPQHSQLVFGQSQMVQLPHPQIEQLHAQPTQQQQLEIFSQQQMEQQQQQQIHISQPLIVGQQQPLPHQQLQQQLQISQPLVINSSTQHQPQQQYQVVPTQQPVIYQLLDVTQAPRGYDERQQQQHQRTQLLGEQSHNPLIVQGRERAVEDTTKRIQYSVKPELTLYSPHYISITEVLCDNPTEEQNFSLAIPPPPQSSSSSASLVKSKVQPHYTTDIKQVNDKEEHSSAAQALLAPKVHDAHHTIAMLQVNVREEHNYSMAPISPKVLSPLPSPKGHCRMRPPQRLKQFLFRKLEKLDYFSQVSAENIANYELQCTSMGQPYMQAKIRTLHQRTIVCGDILLTLFPRFCPALMKDLLFVLEFLGEFHYNTWEQRKQRALISKSSYRTLYSLCAQVLLLFFEFSTPFQSKSLSFEDKTCHIVQRNFLSATATIAPYTASESVENADDTFDDLSLAIDTNILEKMAELKQSL